MKDPELLADAQRQSLEISQSSGAEVAKVINVMASISPELKKDVRAAIAE